MNQIESWSLVALWSIVIAQSVIIVVMLRHIGVLYERMGPSGALVMPSPLAIGSRAPTFRLADLDGRLVGIGQPASPGQAAQLLLFVAPSCPICEQLSSFVQSFARAERASIEVVLASDGPVADHRAYVARHKLGKLPYVISSALGIAYGVSKLPYAVAIDREGIVRAMGLVNSREHLESLMNALETGAESLQQWLRVTQTIPV